MLQAEAGSLEPLEQNLNHAEASEMAMWNQQKMSCILDVVALKLPAKIRSKQCTTVIPVLLLLGSLTILLELNSAVNRVKVVVATNMIAMEQTTNRWENFSAQIEKKYYSVCLPWGGWQEKTSWQWFSILAWYESINKLFQS